MGATGVLTVKGQESEGFAGERVVPEHAQVRADPDHRPDVPEEPVAQHPEVGQTGLPDSGNHEVRELGWQIELYNIKNRS